MKEWIISVGAVVILTAIASLVIPEGKIGSYVKSIFSFLLVLVIIKPMFYISQNDLDFSNAFSSNTIVVQQDYLEYIINKNLKNIKENCNNLLKEIGVNNVKIDLIYSIENQVNCNVNLIKINLKDAVIISDKTHIDIVKEIKTAISNYLNLTIEKVVVYE